MALLVHCEYGVSVTGVGCRPDVVDVEIVVLAVAAG